MLDITEELSDVQFKGSLLLTELEQISIAWWGKHDANIIPLNIFGLATGGAGWHVLLDADDTFRFDIHTSGTTQSLTSDAAIDVTAIHHYCATYDGTFSTTSQALYVDGAPVATTVVAGTGSRGITLTPVLVGGAAISGTNEIGWLAIWRRELRPSEAAFLSNKNSPMYLRNGLVAYWRLMSPFIERDLVGGVDLYPLTSIPAYIQRDFDIVDTQQTWSGFVSGAPAAAGVTINVPLGTQAYTGLVPSVATSVEVDVPLGTQAYTGLVPVISTGVQVDAPLGTQAYTGLVPAIQTGTSIAVPLGTQAYTGLVPAIATGVQVDAPLGIHAYTGIVPTIATGVQVASPPGGHVYQGFVPTIQAGADYEQVAFRFRNDDGSLLAP